MYNYIRISIIGKKMKCFRGDLGSITIVPISLNYNNL